MLIFSFFFWWNYFCPQNLLHADFSSRNFLHVDFFSSWNLYVDFSPRKTDIFHVTCRVLILFWKSVARWFVSSWNFYIDFSPLKLIFFMELVACIFLFVKIFTHWFCSWDLMRLDFSLREFFALIFLVLQRILFIKLIACYFFFIKLVACWFFSSWNWFCLGKFVTCWFFVYETCDVSFFCSWDLLHVDLSLRESCKFVFLIMNPIALWNLMLADTALGIYFELIFVHQNCFILVFPFVKLIYWCFSSLNWFCSWNTLCADFIVCGTWTVLIFIL